MHSSTDSDIRPPQANFISQAHITSQAYTLARLTRPWFLICLSMTSQADFISQANITSQAGTRARLTRPWFFISQAYTELLVSVYTCDRIGAMLLQQFHRSP